MGSPDVRTAATQGEALVADAETGAHALRQLMTQPEIDLTAQATLRPVTDRGEGPPGRSLPSPGKRLGDGEAARLFDVAKRAPALEHAQHVARLHRGRKDERDTGKTKRERQRLHARRQSAMRPAWQGQPQLMHGLFAPLPLPHCAISIRNVPP